MLRLNDATNFTHPRSFALAQHTKKRKFKITTRFRMKHCKTGKKEGKGKK
jgi:hypothetical protein